MAHFKFLNDKNFLILFLTAALLISCSRKEDLLPGDIDGAKLTKKITGDEARILVDKIHFSPVAAGRENEIGYYDKNGNQSTIYITYYGNSEEAIADFDKMTKKISPGNSVFVAPSFIDFTGLKVYRCFGMGQAHFVFVHNNALIWLSTETVFSKSFLGEYIKLLK